MGSINSTTTRRAVLNHLSAADAALTVESLDKDYEPIADGGKVFHSRNEKAVVVKVFSLEDTVDFERETSFHDHYDEWRSRDSTFPQGRRFIVERIQTLRGASIVKL